MSYFEELLRSVGTDKGKKSEARKIMERGLKQRMADKINQEKTKDR